MRRPVAAAGLLETISGPSDLRHLGRGDLSRLCAEIRAFLVAAVSRNGGHLGSNLGMVEITVALHRVFDTPRDSIVFDTGHQAYVHKMLTGRLGGFARLRRQGGLSGYPSRAESEHDVIENSHASTGLSYGLALATARALEGAAGRTVCVVGDGALTGGLAYEALNQMSQVHPGLVIVLNDNGRSYAPTVGGLARNLERLRLESAPLAGARSAGPASFFGALGIEYRGPFDGHDVETLERALHDVAGCRRPVVLHVVTDKGHGYQPAIDDEIDKLHAVSSFDPVGGVPVRRPRSWTDLFGEALLEAADRDHRVVAVTAGMASSTGLLPFAVRYPDRLFDVGIAEQHAVTFATGLALGGLRPVVCIFSTFLQRAFDQMVCDAALHNAPVVFVVDRAGITGEDGPSHHGTLDLALLRAIPGMTVSAPSTPDEMRRLLATGLAHSGPFALRFPKGAARGAGAAPLDPLPIGRMEILRTGHDIALLAAGKMVEVATTAAEEMAAADLSVSVVNVRYVKPLDPGIAPLVARHHVAVTIEDGVACGGLGTAVLELLNDAGVRIPLRRLGIPDRFIEHGSQESILSQLGLDAPGVAVEARTLLAASEVLRDRERSWLMPG